jgi:hypothetical protein
LPFYLCGLCADAFWLGQANRGAELLDLAALAAALEEFSEGDDNTLRLADYEEDDDEEDENAGV